MSFLLDSLIDQFLDRLETQAVKLLTWGVVDGDFSEAEILELAASLLESHDCDTDPWDLIDAMQARNLLFDFNLRAIADLVVWVSAA